MKTQRIHIDDILKSFFAIQLEGKKGVSRQRIERVERALRECLEQEAERILVDSDVALLAAERDFREEGAVARIMHAADLTFVLSVFVNPPWLLPDLLDRRVQLRMADALTGYVLFRGLIDRYDYSCPLLDIRGGIDRARRDLTRERRHP